ncbi:sigma-70 family RNA polymerase sigma factor [Phormidium tenue FACHB-886]|nr:sigma-70 family RNA polymerase sigma factor [Phormidium tenue FACHB-886]
MKSRQSIAEIFSTFVQFVDDRFHHWAIEPRLWRSMQRELKQAAQLGIADTAEAVWVLHWCKLRQNQPNGLAEGHLSAYLQEACYWASSRMITQPAGLSYTLSDCFQIAVTTVPKVLENYRSEQGASLKTYAILRFSNAIRDALRQHQETSRRTDWGLLRKVSQKCLTEALQMAGLSAESVAQYRLAWTSFKLLYAPNDAATRQLAAPDAKTWQAIAQLYNQQRLRQAPASPETDPKILENWLKNCAKYIRAYLAPPTTSLNVQKFEEGAGELQDDLPDRLESNPMAVLIAHEEMQERQTQKTQLAEVLEAALKKLDPQVQTLLDLYYSKGLTQQQIAQQLEVKQYTVSRRLSSTKEILLKTLAQWSQETLHISLTSPVVQQMSHGLEEWLQTHYRTFESFSRQEGDR